MLKELLDRLEYTCLSGSLEIEITDLVYDSRMAEKGCIFFCMTGANIDSHAFIEEVISKGAAAIIVEKDVVIPTGVTVIRTDNSRRALALMSEAYYKYPAKRLTTVAITGTKGKTTIAYMLKALLEKSGKKVGIIGTIGAFYGDVEIKTKNTTPESYELQKILYRMAEAGCTHVVLEVSSQAYMTHRVEGLLFDYGIFSNISPDHIGEGEHSSFEEYLNFKSMLFQNCKTGIINQDDEKWQEILKNHTCQVLTYGCSDGADLCGYDVTCLKEPGFIGIDFRVSGLYNIEVKVGSMGRFNAYNAMAAMMAAAYLGVSEEAVQDVMYTMSVRGRVEPVAISDKFHLLIDYAHNALSTESLLSTILEYNPKRLICVFGAGGNRSKLRRYDMGEIAGRYANLSVLTADNPRFEDVKDIIADIKIGMERSNGNFIVIPNRREAIKYSIEFAQDGDIIALFGKGHEDYQEIKGVKYPFDERDVITDILKELKGRK